MLNFKITVPIAVLALLTLVGCASKYEIKPQTSELIVLKSLETLENIKKGKKFNHFKEALKDAAGCAIFPSLYKAGFFFGAEGGNGIVISRDTQGNWGHPAFYTLAGGSWGFQFGAQKAAVVLIIRSRGAIEAILRHQGKFGADVSAAFGPIGSGLGGATTSNLAADIYAFSDVKGLFAGLSLEGAGLVRRNDLNREYYGKPVTVRSILLEHAQKNTQAKLLRDALKVH